MSSKIVFIVMSHGQDYHLELNKELCNWNHFTETLSNTVPQQDSSLTSPLYYFDGNNVSHTIVDASSFATILSEATNSKNNVVHLYNGDNYIGAETTSKSNGGEWVLAPEEITTHSDIDPSSSVPTDNTPFADLYSTSFAQFGQVIHKHRALIDSNPLFRMLIGRFAASLATTPGTEMIPRLDQYLDAYNSNKTENGDNTEEKSRGKEKSRHCGRRGRHQQHETECNNRREFIATIPDELAQFLLSSGVGRRHHRHHHHHPAGRHPWMDHHHQYASPPDFVPSLFGGGKHKHHHHHEHHHPSYYQSFGPGKSMDPFGSGAHQGMKPGCGGASPYFGFGGRHGHGGFPMMKLWPDKQWKRAYKQQWKQAMQEHYRGHHPCRYPAEPSSSSSSSDTSDSSSSSDDEDKKADRKEAAGRHHQQRKLWKSLSKEHGRRHGHHGRMHGNRHGRHGFHGHHGFPGPHGPAMPPFTSHPHLSPPDYIEDTFSQMNLGDSKKQ